MKLKMKTAGGFKPSPSVSRVSPELIGRGHSSLLNRDVTIVSSTHGPDDGQVRV